MSFYCFSQYKKQGITLGETLLFIYFGVLLLYLEGGESLCKGLTDLLGVALTLESLHTLTHEET